MPTPPCSTRAKCARRSLTEPPQLPVTIVVTPMRAKLSQPGSRAISLSTCACTSTKPGATTRPLASSTCVAVALARSPTAAMRSPRMPTSAARAAAPVPSTTWPPRISRSNGCCAALAAANSASAATTGARAKVPRGERRIAAMLRLLAGARLRQLGFELRDLRLELGDARLQLRLLGGVAEQALQDDALVQLRQLHGQVLYGQWLLLHLEIELAQGHRAAHEREPAGAARRDGDSTSRAGIVGVGRTGLGAVRPVHDALVVAQADGVDLAPARDETASQRQLHALYLEAERQIELQHATLVGDGADGAVGPHLDLVALWREDRHRADGARVVRLVHFERRRAHRRVVLEQ